MLTLFRRHLKTCAHRSEGRTYRRCHCPIWADGLAGESDIRVSLKTKDWERAQGIVRQWEAEGRSVGQSKPVTVEQAAENFLADVKARQLAEATIYKYNLLLRGLKDFSRRGGYGLLRELDTAALTAFRVEWKNGPLSALKKLQHLRTFFGFCVRRHWTAENPASGLKPPKVVQRPTLPFTHDEMVKILAAADKYGARAAHNARLNAVRIRSLVLVMRYSGLRIGDAVSLSLDRLSGNTLFLFTAKTGTPVRVSLPEFVADALRGTPPMNDRYWFWTGVGKLCTAVRVWEGRLQRLFGHTGIPGGHTHRFRDTFAVELLLAGVPLERVSVVLGHQSIRVTERHYAPWVRARQEQLEADLQRVWSRDPLVLLHTKGTPEVHGESERPN